MPRQPPHGPELWAIFSLEWFQAPEVLLPLLDGVVKDKVPLPASSKKSTVLLCRAENGDPTRCVGHNADKLGQGECPVHRSPTATDWLKQMVEQGR